MIMKLHQLYMLFALSAVTAGSLTSCADFLKEEPYSYVGIDEVGNDNEAVGLWVTGVYSKWLDDMARWGNFPRLLDMDCDYASGPDWAFSNLGAGNFQGDEVPNTLWNGCYNLINRANVAIEYVNAITGANEKVKNNGLGELYFQKAFAYFLLVRAYGDIPLFDVSIDAGADYNQPRRPIAEVYEEIIRLLEQEAIPRLYRNTDSGYRTGHVCAGTAVALLSKVYVTMGAASMASGAEVTVKTGAAYKFNGDTKELEMPVSKVFLKTQLKGYEGFDSQACYREAARWAGYLISPDSEHDYGVYGLLPYEKLWTKAGYDETGVQMEHLFSLRPKSGDEVYSSGILEWYHGIDNGSGVIRNGLYIGSRYHWYCLFENHDFRITQGVKHRFVYSYQDENENNKSGFYYPNTAQYKLMATGYDAAGNKVANPVAPYNDGRNYYFNVGSECLAFTNKYGDVTDATQKYSDAYYPFLRMADVYLIYAEAQNELGNTSEAVARLNEVRRRSNAGEMREQSSKAILRSAIIEERAKELALEGDRRWDLVRWGIYKEVMNSIGGTNKDGSRSNYDEAGINKHREDRHWLFPLPSSEVSTNESIEGNNPGWN